MTAHQGKVPRGRNAAGKVSPFREDDSVYLLDESQVDQLRQRLDLVPDVAWRWITSSGPISEDGSMRLILQGQLPAGSYFAFDQESKDFIPWAGYQFAMFGATSDQDWGEGPRILIPFSDEITALVGPWNVVLLYRRASHPQFPTVTAELIWQPDGPEIGGINGIPTEGRTEALKVGERGLALLDMVAPTRRGPTPGTVERAKYSSAEEWHSALRTVALTKPIRTQVPTQIIEAVANRLSIGGTTISPTTVRRYMARDEWGPKTPEELRNGKWNCACHSCRP